MYHFLEKKLCNALIAVRFLYTFECQIYFPLCKYQTVQILHISTRFACVQRIVKLYNKQLLNEVKASADNKPLP